MRQFHDGTLARVQNDDEFSDPFTVTNGIKQGCVLAPTLFSMMFSAILTAAFQDGENGIPIRYRFDGKLLNLKRLQANSKVQTEVLDEFLFADDIAKGAATEEKMQKGVDQVSVSCDNYDLTTSIKKTEVVYRPAPGNPYKEPSITVKGQRLQVVDKFTYLGSTLSRVAHIDDEVNARIAQASAAFGQLRGSVWDRSGIRLDTKLKVYKAVVPPTLCPFSIVITSPGEERDNLSAFVRLFDLRLFGFVCFFFLGVWERLRFVIVALSGLFSYLFCACETWTVYQRHAKD